MRALQLNSPAGYPLRFEANEWVMYDATMTTVLGRFPDLTTAKRVRDRRIKKIPTAYSEHRLTGAKVSGKVRYEEYEGKRHMVVPIVALVEGVIFASNADTPELVTMDVLANAAPGWNGEPLVLQHPENSEGAKISANSPEVLEQYRVGRVFNSRIEGKKLKMEGWIQVDRIDKVPGAREVVDAIEKDDKPVEVSVGAFVDVEKKSGRFDGKNFQAVWKNVVPDHMALLPLKDRGACNADMGCGVRA